MKRFFDGALVFSLLLIQVAVANAELIKGQVLLPDGTPAAKADIWHEGYGKAGMPPNTPVKLDVAGRFQLEILRFPPQVCHLLLENLFLFILFQPYIGR